MGEHTHEASQLEFCSEFFNPECFCSAGFIQDVCVNARQPNFLACILSQPAVFAFILNCPQVSSGLSITKLSVAAGWCPAPRRRTPMKRLQSMMVGTDLQ